MNCFLKKLCKLLCTDDIEDEVRIIPHVGPVTEQSGPPKIGRPSSEYSHHHHVSKNRRYLIMAFTITDSQQIPISVEFKTKKGNPAPVDGIPEWSTDNSDVFGLAPAADGMTCMVAAAGPLGIGKVQVTADADLGAGVQHVIGVLDGTVTGGNAATVVLTPGTPEEQPEVTP